MKLIGNSKARLLNYAMIMVAAFSVSQLSCMRVVNTVPTTKQLFQRYKFSEADLKIAAFHVSNRIVLKKSSEKYRYYPGHSIDLKDNRQDDVYYIDVETEGHYVTRDSIDEKGRIKWWPFGKKKKEFVRVNFYIKDLGRIDFDFIENSEGYFMLKKDPNGKVVVKDEKYVCLDGCKSLLLVRARERDYYRGVDHQPYWDILVKSMLVFLMVFGVLYIYSEM